MEDLNDATVWWENQTQDMVALVCDVDPLGSGNNLASQGTE